MLRYENGRFHALGVSFRLPEGFLLETEPEFCQEYGLGAWTPDRRYYVEWQIERDCRGTRYELEELFAPDSGIHSLGNIESVLVNGMKGHHVKYRSKDGERWEFRLTVGGGIEAVVTVRPAEGGVGTADCRPFLIDALEGIELDREP